MEDLEVGETIALVQDTDKKRALVNTNISFRFHRMLRSC
jgi:hypothetical protein